MRRSALRFLPTADENEQRPPTHHQLRVTPNDAVAKWKAIGEEAEQRREAAEHEMHEQSVEARLMQYIDTAMPNMVEATAERMLDLPSSANNRLRPCAMTCTPCGSKTQNWKGCSPSCAS
jgi:hypothetical protein